MTQPDNKQNPNSAFIDECIEGMKENAERVKEENMDMRYGATYVLGGGYRVCLADLRAMSFSEPLQTKFNEWYAAQTSKGLVDASYSIPTLNTKQFEQAVDEFISIELAIEKGQVKNPPKPVSEAPDFISNILTKSLISGKPGL